MARVAIERSQVNAVVLAAAARMIGGKEKKMPVIGEEGRPPVRAVFAEVEFGQALSGSAAGIDLPERIAVVRRIHDHVVAVPGAPAGVRRVRQHRHGSAGDGYLAQLAVGEEADGSSIGCPEQAKRAFGARKLFGGRAV